MLARATLRQLERVAHDAVGAAAGEHRLLHGKFVLGSGIHAPAQFRIFTFDILAHHDKVDIGRCPPRQR